MVRCVGDALLQFPEDVAVDAGDQQTPGALDQSLADGDDLLGRLPLPEDDLRQAVA
jgi:hypothetical protein